MLTSPVLDRPGSASATRVGVCVCCGGERWLPKFRVPRQCRGCGFIRADMEVSHDEIKKLYQEDYFRGKEYGNYLEDQDSHRKNFAHRFQMMSHIAPGVKSLFEIGCAYGFWLDYCSKQGIECAGVDVCEDAVRHAARELKQNATARDFLTLPVETGRYDAFCMWDTIEHLAAPELFVDRAHDALAPGGWLFLTTGDIGSRAARWRGSRWRMIHPPTHLQYFSRSSMDRFLNRHGFTPVAWRTQSMHRTIGEVLGRVSTLSRGVPRWTAAALSRLTPGLIQRRGFWLDLGDIMFVAARRNA